MTHKCPACLSSISEDKCAEILQSPAFQVPEDHCPPDYPLEAGLPGSEVYPGLTVEQKITELFWAYRGGVGDMDGLEDKLNLRIDKLESLLSKLELRIEALEGKLYP